MLLGHITNKEKLAIANAQLQLVDAFRCNGELMISLFVHFVILVSFLNELLHSILSNKLVMVCTGGQISVVQALLEEFPKQFLTFMQGRDIKPRPLHVAPTSA